MKQWPSFWLRSTQIHRGHLVGLMAKQRARQYKALTIFFSEFQVILKSSRVICLVCIQPTSYVMCSFAFTHPRKGLGTNVAFYCLLRDNYIMIRRHCYGIVMTVWVFNWENVFWNYFLLLCCSWRVDHFEMTSLIFGIASFTCRLIFSQTLDLIGSDLFVKKQVIIFNIILV